VVILCGLNLNPVNFVALPMLVGIGVDNGIHLVARRRDLPGLGGPTGIAIWRCAVTTLLGFGSLVTAATPGLASLGWISSIGMTTCLAASLLVLPPMLRRS
jgi:predicted RND superfamily exporter protein